MSNVIPPPRELISDSLKGLLSEEEMAKAYEETFITVLLAYEEKSRCVLGNLAGIELTQTGMKIDFRISLDDAFNFVSNFVSDKKYTELRAIILSLGDKITKLIGPYLIRDLKIVEIDSSNRLCVLAVDLFNTKLETSK